MNIADILVWLRHLRAILFARDEIRFSRVGKFLLSMLSKKVTTPKTHTQPDNMETESPVLANCPGHNGTLPESSGNKFILLLGDQFTKWYEAMPMSNQESSIVAKALVIVWVSRFGCPSNLHSDKCSIFMKKLFKNMCKEPGINRTAIKANHPKGNAMIHLNNRTIEESFAKYLGELHNTRSKYLPLEMMAYRSSIHFVTKYSFLSPMWKLMRTAD